MSLEFLATAKILNVVSGNKECNSLIMTILLNLIISFLNMVSLQKLSKLENFDEKLTVTKSAVSWRVHYLKLLKYSICFMIYTLLNMVNLLYLGESKHPINS